LGIACESIAAFAPSMVIVSLGLDTYWNDPISDLALTTDGYRRCGEVVKQLGLPTVVLQEGGYDIEAIGRNAHAWLTPFV
jgi:acetoin utilization deacetylase AcuC-like enzyme